MRGVDRTIARNLGLGDVARLPSDGNTEYSSFTVVKIDEDGIHVVRPYVHVGDFSYTGGVLHYLGTENFTLGPDTEVDLLRKNPVPVR